MYTLPPKLGFSWMPSLVRGQLDKELPSGLPGSHRDHARAKI